MLQGKLIRQDGRWVVRVNATASIDVTTGVERLLDETRAEVALEAVQRQLPSEDIAAQLARYRKIVAIVAPDLPGPTA